MYIHDMNVEYKMKTSSMIRRCANKELSMLKKYMRHMYIDIWHRKLKYQQNCKKIASAVYKVIIQTVCAKYKYKAEL